MHTWARKGIALAVSGVLTVGMAASLPFSSFAESAGENVIFVRGYCPPVPGQRHKYLQPLGRIFMGSNFRGIPAAVSAT